MLISELAKEVHENAVAHGWWDDEREAPEIIALIHSEWSEALEEARAGRPLLWYAPDIDNACWRDECNAYIGPGHICHGQYSAAEHPTGGCPKHYKPEGIAVELIDGCIRILDYIGQMNGELTDDGKASLLEGLYSESNTKKVPEKLPELVAALHLYTALSMNSRSYHDLLVPDMFALCGALAAALSWVKKQGLDPLAILLEKHAYNKTRPYKHGKKF